MTWLLDRERAAVKEGLCQTGALVATLVEDARRKSPKASPDPAAWQAYGVSWAVGRVEELLRQYRGLRGEEGNGGAK